MTLIQKKMIFVLNSKCALNYTQLTDEKRLTLFTQKEISQEKKSKVTLIPSFCLT